MEAESIVSVQQGDLEPKHHRVVLVALVVPAVQVVCMVGRMGFRMVDRLENLEGYHREDS